jgi:hypothetical protein
MEYLKVMVLFPLFIPVAVAGTGGAAGFLAISKYRQANLNFRPILLTLILLAMASALIPNIGQQLYDLGLSFPFIDVINGVSYFIFAFATIGAWRLLQSSWSRWLLIILLPISFAQPIMSTFAHICWSVGGFAP